MKVEVEIPDGKNCDECQLNTEWEGEEWCNYLGQLLQYTEQGILKVPDCPSLKEKEEKIGN